MSEQIKHECGVALIRLRKPLSFYIEKYGTPAYGLNKLYVMMEKQINRGQDGAGVANVVLHSKPGTAYIHRLRSAKALAVKSIFKKIFKNLKKVQSKQPEKYKNAAWLKQNIPFTGELLLGHLRYGTYSDNGVESCHPFIRRNNWRSRNLVVAGNFNMTNVDEQYEKLISLGQHPVAKADTITVMEKIGHFLDDENQKLFTYYNQQGLSNEEISLLIEDNLELQRVLQRACKDFDGGYTMAGLTGYGAAFVARDPSGIRPAYYYADDEVVVVASERPAIKMAWDIAYDDIKEIKPAHALVIQKDGSFAEHEYIQPLEKKSCSFERIYFSRGTDPQIYTERKQLGKLLTPAVLKTIDYDLGNTVFSFVPHTSEPAFYGMLDSIEDFLAKERQRAMRDYKTNSQEMNKVLLHRVRVEKLVIKDAKLRTFIVDDAHRSSIAASAYDTTFDTIKKGTDTIVVIDDSIVRGTTLEKSIISMLEKLQPKRIVVVSSAPQIRYPDCYGIDMSRIHEFVAFRAAIALHQERKSRYIVEEVYQQCLDSMKLDIGKIKNHVQAIYEPFSYEEVSDKIAQIVTPKDAKSQIKVIYQTVDNLHIACPFHLGDWYFTGEYPTAGGNKMVNQAFINFMEGKSGRAY